MEAYIKADFFKPERWHSITVEVKMGTISKTKKDSLLFQGNYIKTITYVMEIVIYWQQLVPIVLLQANDYPI